MADEIRNTLLHRALAAVYGAVVRLRNWMHDSRILSSHESSLPVVSVGNITVGGSGKSPFTAYLEERFRAVRPVILLRGYRGSEAGPKIVHPSDTAEMFGDEAIMHARAGRSVVVARRRATGADFIASENLGGLILLDDGFQHRALKRDVNLVLLDITTQRAEEILSDRLLPAGHLREPSIAALRRATAVILLRRGEKPERAVPPLLRDIPCFFASLDARGFREAGSGTRYPLDAFAGSEGHAVSAIAKPDPFFSMLERHSIHLLSKRALPDHALLPSELPRPLFVTEKDLVKIRGPLEQVYVLETGIHLQDEERFFALLAKHLPQGTCPSSASSKAFA